MICYDNEVGILSHDSRTEAGTCQVGAGELDTLCILPIFTYNSPLSNVRFRKEENSKIHSGVVS
jgi:hypothetical protein